MTNRLSQETSPYLLQHAENPVDWFPWSAEAFEKARAEDKPVFLSIGYAACHWCHVMAHESFADPEIANLLNLFFVSIKVDREERPDIDDIYMNAVVALTGQGGWPMSLFLTPDGRPFYGGTYFPPKPRYGMPSFRQVLEGIAESWKNERDQVNAVGDQLVDHLRDTIQITASAQPLQMSIIEKATQVLLDSYDRENGGWGGAPKFPQPMALEFLLRQVSRGNDQARDTAIHALHAMSAGGMYDLVGSGFHRYSTDAHWLVPHFEKMLYDNALLSRDYLYAYLLTSHPDFRQVCEDTLDFVLREMTHPAGGFFSSLDADSEGQEGKYYLWSLPEIDSVMQNPEETEWFHAAYGLNQTANFEGQWILRRAQTDADLSRQFQMDENEVKHKLRDIRSRLQTKRTQRIRPGTDDKILVSWNALVLGSFAEAARLLNRLDYLDAARKNAAFLLENLYRDGQLQRTWRNGQAHLNAYLEDYAALILGLLALYQADPQLRWFQAAQQLAQQMLDQFRDPQGGFFDTPEHHDALIVRPRNLQDNAIPSGNALAAHALLQLSAFSENPSWRDLAEELIRPVQDLAMRYPTAFSYWLIALDFAVGPVQQVAIIGSQNDEKLKSFIRTYDAAFRPRSILAVTNFPPPAGSPELLADRPLMHGAPTAYVCENFACQLPATTPDQFKQQLDSPG